MNGRTAAPSDDEVRAALARLLDSEVFASAARLQRFLSYVVEQTLAGNHANIKGYTVGVEVFDRATDFDPAIDAIVRVEAGRLRGKLREYYDTVGAGDALRIELPKGSYVPRFVNVNRRTSAAPSAVVQARTTLLVLPFRNQSGQVEQDYFADGLSEDLMAALSRVRDLTLIGRYSSFHYKHLDATPARIRTETGADYLLEGSVRRSAERIRVAAQLVATASQELVWSDRYDRELEDVFALQDDVVANIVRALEVQLLAPAGPATAPDLEAYDLVSRGRERFWSYRPADVDEAQRLFASALERMPDYALAHAWRARALTVPYAFNWSRDRAALDAALVHARTAARLAPELPLAHAMIAWTQVWRGEIDEALAAGQRAVALDEDDVDAQAWYAVALISAGRGGEALPHTEIALRLDPHTPAICIFIDGLAHWLERHLETAAASFARGIARAPDFLAFYILRAATCAELGERTAAIAAIAELERRNPAALDEFAAQTIFTDAASCERLNRFRTLAHAWLAEETS